MPADRQQIKYEALVQRAMRGVIRHVLEIARDEGLPGEHHFYIVFDTQAPNVELSDRLRQRYPTEMTVVLQHQFWDLKIHNTYFEVKLSFSGISERLVVPFASIKAFVDPSVPYGFQLEPEDDDETDASVIDPYGQDLLETRFSDSPQTRSSLDDRSSRGLAPAQQEDNFAIESSLPSAASLSELDEQDEGKENDSKIVRLDFFRKDKD